MILIWEKRFKRQFSEDNIGNIGFCLGILINEKNNL